MERLLVLRKLILERDFNFGHSEEQTVFVKRKSDSLTLQVSQRRHVFIDSFLFKYKDKTGKVR